MAELEAEVGLMVAEVPEGAGRGRVDHRKFRVVYSGSGAMTISTRRDSVGIISNGTAPLDLN